MSHHAPLRRAIARGAAAATILAGLAAVPSSGDLSSRYSAHQQQAGTLRSNIQGYDQRIQGYEGSVANLQSRLAVIQHSVTVQEVLLAAVRTELITAQTRLRGLEARYDTGRQVLARQLVADYESPPPTIVGVVMSSHGFDDLLNQANNLRAIDRQNAQTIRVVLGQKRAVTAQAKALAAVERRRRAAASAVLVERDQVAQLRLSIVNRELAVARARDRARSQLTSLRRTLSHEAAKLDQLAAASQAASAASQAASFSGGAGIAPAGCVNTPFVPHGGSYGFFPAAGTNYSVNQEPVIAARLDALGKALQLQLTGISGYRSPQHSVEVGGFADDPHTQGVASDTPGVEGVPEATLERFCLTRPFAGPAEADHIQEL